MSNSSSSGRSLRFRTVAATLFMLLVVTSSSTPAQFSYQWLDIGEYQHRYRESGAPAESDTGMDYPAELRWSGHLRGRASWIGVKDWTDENGQHYPFYVGQIGPRLPGVGITFPVQNEVIARYDDTQVFVDGKFSTEYATVVNQVDPQIPADRMIHNIYNQKPGVTTTRKAYAYTNEHFDNFHIVTYEYCNSGNVDGDEDVELPGQTLNDVFFFHMHRWRGNRQGAKAHPWGKYNVIDIVGDGHADYPVDFSAVYLWYGLEINEIRFNHLGTPLWEDSHRTVADGDSVGRLAGIGFDGRVTLHADRSVSDRRYVRCTPETFDICQPHTMGWVDTDDSIAAHGANHQDTYELGILTRENPKYYPGGSSRMYPHYADRVEPSGNFWGSVNDPRLGGVQGGHSATDGYGPYELNFGDCIHISVADVVAGISYDASVQVGRAFKVSGGDTRLRIAYDANGDGIIDETPFNLGMNPKEWVHNVFTGTERMTKNQWFMSQRDSLFKSMQRAVDLFAASEHMTKYPIPEAPRAPTRFDVASRPDRIELSWIPNGGGPPVDHWEVYRTSKFDDNFLDPDGDNVLEYDDEGNLITGYECIAGCPGTPALPSGASSFVDTSPVRGMDYYYYLQAVGTKPSRDPTGLKGSPTGRPLQSSRYLTQTFHPANLKREPYGETKTINDARVVPNPVNLGSNESVRFAAEDQVAFFNIPGYCTIKIFTEIGELIHTIEHNDGSGDEIWRLTTQARQLLVSGIYIAVIEETDSGGRRTGETIALKFVVIR